ncbi:MFS transporter [Archangium lansingense]|uniref:MFS transporter n=1 Tax=Archangium lansingense TaxID=2995310 RepID=A0ABT3ZU72_9BACT|nr:MFS transporter [Archangium lansinium]MCY1072950.1 MFS transporter [Archangium lansinium]
MRTREAHSGQEGPGFRTFVAICLGQAVSMVGSRASRLALGIWLFQRTGAVTDFALVAMCDALPVLLLLPFTGVVADRYDRRRVMLWADSAAALCTLAVAGLVLSGHFQSWHLYLAVIAGASASALQSPAWSAAISQLVPPAQLSRAVGLVQVSEGMTDILAPTLAGWLLAMGGMMAALVFDFATFLVGVSLLLLLRFPAVPRVEAGGQPGSAWREAVRGWEYVASRRELVGLLVLASMVTMTLCSMEVLVPPMLLAHTSPAVMGMVMSVAGVGALCGSVAMSTWSGPRRKMDGVLGAGALMGLALIGAGLGGSVVVMAVAGWVAMFCMPVVWSCAHAVWQLRIPAELQGRAFGLRRMVGEATAVVVFFGAGPLVDRVLEPLLAPDGALAGSLGGVFGVGKGRGVGLLLFLLGLLLMTVMAVVRARPGLYRIEDDVLQDNPTHATGVGG